MSDGKSSESALVQEMRRLRAMPGNCEEANALIDAAISCQLTAESRMTIGERWKNLHGVPFVIVDRKENVMFKLQSKRGFLWRSREELLSRWRHVP